MSLTSYFFYLLGTKIGVLYPLEQWSMKPGGRVVGCGSPATIATCSPQNVPCFSTHMSLCPCSAPSWVSFALIWLSGSSLVWASPTIEPAPHLLGLNSASIPITGTPVGIDESEESVNRMGCCLFTHSREQGGESNHYYHLLFVRHWTRRVHLWPLPDSSFER